MTITHHLGAESLMSYAAGAMPAALSALAGAHIAMCHQCRRELTLFEHVGGALLESLAPIPLRAAKPALAALQSTSPPAAKPPGGNAANPVLLLARDDFQSVSWRRIGIGLWHRPLPLQGKGTLQLIKAAPGATVPDHGHAGCELTLVLRGALADASGRYGVGDIADLDEEVEHTPVADADTGCICAIANEMPTRFSGLLARLLQPWHGL